MEDHKLINRKENYRKCKFTIMESRERYHLSLRKQTIDDFIINRRMKTKSNTNNSFTLEINPNDLEIDQNYKNHIIKDLENEIELISKMLTSDDFNYKKFAVNLLRVYLINNDPTVKEEKIKILRLFVQFGIFNELCYIITEFKDEQLIFESYWILINLPEMKLDQDIIELSKFCDDKMIETYLRHIRSEYSDIFDNVMWFLSLLVQQSSECRDKIIQSKIFGEVMKILRKESNSFDVIEKSLWFLSSSMKLTSTTPPQVKISECLEIFANYIYLTEQILVSQCLWGIYYISEFEEKVTNLYKHIIDSGSVVKIMKINYSKFGMCLIPCVRILGNMCTGTSDIVDELLDMNILDFFDNLLSLSKEKLNVREIIWAISNITAGKIEHCEKVLNSSLFGRIIEYMSDCESKVIKEAVYVINNMTVANVFHITMEMVRKGVLNRICEILEKHRDKDILKFTLESLYNILYVGESFRELFQENKFLQKFDEYGGVTLVENLQNHTNTDVYKLAQKILENFYVTQEIQT